MDKEGGKWHVSSIHYCLFTDRSYTLHLLLPLPLFPCPLPFPPNVLLITNLEMKYQLSALKMGKKSQSKLDHLHLVPYQLHFYEIILMNCLGWWRGAPLTTHLLLINSLHFFFPELCFQTVNVFYKSGLVCASTALLDWHGRVGGSICARWQMQKGQGQAHRGIESNGDLVGKMPSCKNPP